MKSHTEYLTFNLPARMAFENITPTIEAIVTKSGVQEGLCLVKPRHRSVMPDAEYCDSNGDFLMLSEVGSVRIHRNSKPLGR